MQSRTTSRRRTSSRFRSRWTMPPDSCCCTTPAIRWTSESCASSSADESSGFDFERRRAHLGNSPPERHLLDDEPVAGALDERLLFQANQLATKRLARDGNEFRE